MERIFTFCDRCNPHQSMERRRYGRGYAEMDFEMAQELGWIIVDGKHICIECQDEEDENS